MRNALLASAVMVLASGCLCGAYNGAGDKVYAHGDDSLIVCSNGGFVANLASGSIEGRLVETGMPPQGDTEYAANRGDTGELEFRLIELSNGTATTPELGNTIWTEKMLDATALDHADVQCTDLETRSWWTAQ